MSAFEKLDNLKHQFGKFIGPALSILVGIYFYMKTASVTVIEQFNPNGAPIKHELIQGPEFRIAALFFILVGIIWLLYVLNVLRSFIGIGVTILALAGALFLLYKDYNIIKQDVDFNNRKEMIFKEIKGRINDIKIAEVEFKNEKGYYTSNIDSLVHYVKNGYTIQYNRKGTLPVRRLTRAESNFIYGKKANKALDYNITDVEAKALLKMNPVPEDLVGIVRDTVYVPVIESIFEAPAYVEQRAKKGLMFDFVPDSLRYIPFSGQTPVKLDTASVSRGDLRISTLLIQMPHPIDTSFTHKVGDLNDNSLKDNWSLK